MPSFVSVLIVKLLFKLYTNTNLTVQHSMRFCSKRTFHRSLSHISLPKREPFQRVQLISWLSKSSKEKQNKTKTDKKRKQQKAARRFWFRNYLLTYLSGGQGFSFPPFHSPDATPVSPSQLPVLTDSTVSTKAIFSVCITFTL